MNEYLSSFKVATYSVKEGEEEVNDICMEVDLQKKKEMQC